MLPTLSEESIELNNYSSEGGVAKAYRDVKGELRLIKVELYGESGKMFEEYYYQNGLLIFVYSEDHRYNVPFYITPEKAKEIGSEPFDSQKTKIVENRYYFDNMKMIRWLNTGNKQVNATSKDFKETEKETIKFSREITAKFKKKT